MGYENADIFNFGINGATAQVVDMVLRQVLEPDQLPPVNYLGGWGSGL